jgi:hypothetical protein
MKKKYKTILLSIAFGVSLLAVLTVVIWWKPLGIKYHNWRIKVLLNTEPEFDPSSGLSFFDGEWGDAFEKHRDKLVKLEYLERKEFPLTSIKTPSLRFRRLWEELQTRFPNNPYAIGLGYESESPATIVVFDRVEKLSEWERIILAHDGSPTSIVKVDHHGEAQRLLPFIGHWASEEGEVCYIISKDAEGNVTISGPPNEVWRTVLRNVHLESGRIMFDRFNYTDPNEDYKSIIDNSGEHFFSGVRCKIMLEVNPSDSNELLKSWSTVSKDVIYADPNVYVLKRIK